MRTGKRTAIFDIPFCKSCSKNNHAKCNPGRNNHCLCAERGHFIGSAPQNIGSDRDKK